MSVHHTPHEDQYYLEALIRHDRHCIESIYRDNAERIKALVLNNGGSAADAGDLFQDALIDIYRQAQRGYLLQCSFHAFFYAVCRNKWLDELKKRARAGVTIQTLERLDDENAEAAAQHLYLHEARLTLLTKAVECLGPSCRNILKLSWSVNPDTGKCRSLEEVAQSLNISYGYLRKKKSECEQALKNKIRASPDFAKLKGE